MHRYDTETLSPATDHHHHHHTHHHQHLSDHHHLANHIVRQIEDPHQDPEEEDDRVSIVTAIRGPRNDYSLGHLFPNLATAAASAGAGSNGVDHHHSQHLDDVLQDDPYLQHQIRGSSTGGTVTSGGVSPPVRTGSSPGSSRSPHGDQGLSPHRHVQDGGYSPNDQGRLQSLTHLTTMHPPLSSVQGSQGLQDSERVNEHLYIDPIYGSHPTGTPHHHQEHDQGPSTPHSPGGHLSRLVFFCDSCSLIVFGDVGRPWLGI